jgi:hypothetical protein
VVSNLKKGHHMKKERNIGSISTFLGADSRIEGTIEFKAPFGWTAG